MRFIPSVLLSLFLAFSCVEQQEVVVDDAQTNPTTSTGTTSGGTTATTGTGSTTSTSTTATTTGGGSGSTCFGNSQDGDSTGSFPLHWREIVLPGKTDWKPYLFDVDDYNASIHYGLPAYTEAQTLTTNGGTDAVFRVRFKALSQPNISECPLRNSGSPTTPNYGKLRVTYQFYTVINNNLVEVGTPYTSEPVDVNGCSQIVSLPYKSIQNAYTSPVVLGIKDVKSDWECNRYGDGSNLTRCPAEVEVTSRTCWKIRLQVETDATDKFR